MHTHNWKKTMNATGEKGVPRDRAWRCTTCPAIKGKRTPAGDPPRKGARVTITSQ